MKKYVRVDIRVVVFAVIATIAWNYYVFFNSMKRDVGEPFSKFDTIQKSECEKRFPSLPLYVNAKKELENKRALEYQEASRGKSGKVRVLLPYIYDDGYFFDIFNGEKFSRGAVIGASNGNFARMTLENWENCEELYLVDPSGKNQYEKLVRDNYPCGTVMKNFSHEVAESIKDRSLDWVYIDGRHDYKSILEELVLWFPKVKVGGVVSGHDYLDRSDSESLEDERAIMNNGMLNKWGKGVKGGVDRFIQEVDVQILIAAYSPAVEFKTWYFRKIRDPVKEVDITSFEEDFEGLEPTVENLKRVRGFRKHEWLPAYDELYEYYDLPRELDYEALPHAHPLGGKCKKVYMLYNEVC